MKNDKNIKIISAQVDSYLYSQASLNYIKNQLVKNMAECISNEIDDMPVDFQEIKVSDNYGFKCHPSMETDEELPTLKSQMIIISRDRLKELLYIERRQNEKNR